MDKNISNSSSEKLNEILNVHETGVLWGEAKLLNAFLLGRLLDIYQNISFYMDDARYILNGKEFDHIPEYALDQFAEFIDILDDLQLLRKKTIF